MNIRLDSEQISQTVTSLEVFHSIWQSILQQIASINRYIRCVQIDGEIYYDGYELYIQHHFYEIKHINIITITPQDSLDETITEIQKYNAKLILAVEDIGKAFYGDLTEENWNQFSNLFEGIGWLYQSLEFCLILIEKTKMKRELTETLRTAADKLKISLSDIEQALNEQEYITVGDIIQYELGNVFELIHEKIRIGEIDERKI
ncbi:hypothetical protein PAE9249_00474 [Paenibacillus sp. CECT 9249]|nr:hypothetical protein PAE9249_00474 [Paenibacillus sp. CECT 9249]